MISLDILNDKLISAEVSGDDIIINVLRAAPTTFDALTDTPDNKTGSDGLYPRVSGNNLIYDIAGLVSQTLEDNVTVQTDGKYFLIRTNTAGSYPDTLFYMTALGAFILRRYTDAQNWEGIQIPPTGKVIFQSYVASVLTQKTTDDIGIFPLGELTESADIAINCASHPQVDAYIVGMTRVATTLTFSNFGKVFNLSMTKNNADLDLVFTLAGTGLVFDVFDSVNNVYTRATTVTIAGTDANNSWELSFKRTGIAGAIIQVTGTIDSFA